MSINITVTGRLTKALSFGKTTSGKLVTSFDLAHNFRERAGKHFNDVATIFFGASVWEEDGAAEVAELGLTKGSRVTVEGVWSKRSWTTKDGQPRINDVLTVTMHWKCGHTQIAKRTKIKRDTVNTVLVVAKSDLAKAASDRYDFLTLEQAAAVAEFDDDPDAVNELITRAQKGEGFYHCVQRLRDQRKERLAKQSIIDELVAAGVTIIDSPGWGDATRRLERLSRNDDPMAPKSTRIV